MMMLEEDAVVKHAAASLKAPSGPPVVASAESAATRALPRAALHSSTSLMLFRCVRSIADEMEWLKRLQEESPNYVRDIMVQSSTMVDLARQGSLDLVTQLALHCREGELLSWTTAHMFEEASKHGHVDMLAFMMANGVNRSHPGLQRLLHDVIEHAESERALVKVLPVLIRGGFDVSAMRKPDGATPLHIACSTLHMTTFKLLIVLGADIHAVANDGTMPLNRSLSAAATASTTAQVVCAGNMATHLRSLGAEETVSLRSYRG